MKNKRFVSVIIPVFRDTSRLLICLKALETQTYPKSCYEIIVINNCPDDKIEDALCDADNVIVADEPAKGSYVARNCGITLTKGDIIAFTDSDCIPDQQWIENGVASLLSMERPGLVAGRIDLFYQDNGRCTLAELFETLTAFPQEGYLKKANFGATANVFTMKEVFEKVGLFRSDLQSGGDTEWGKRVFAAGYEQKYADDARVKHPARSTIRELTGKFKRVIRGRFALLETGRFIPSVFFRQLITEGSPFIFVFRAYRKESLSGVSDLAKALLSCTIFVSIRILLFCYYQTKGYFWEKKQDSLK